MGEMGETGLRILAVVAVFAVLVFLVLKGKIGSMGASSSSKSEAQEGVVDAKKAKKYGPIEKAYLLASDRRNSVTFEVHYQSGKSALEVVQAYSERYEELKAHEPKKTSVTGSFGNAIEIAYEDGRTVTADCAWISYEAAGLREEMLKSGSSK